MKSWLTLPIALMLIACAGTPSAPPPNWSSAKVARTEITEPEALPLLCKMPFETVPCYQAVEQYEIVAEANTGIAQKNAEALKKTEASVDLLIEAGKLQQQLSNYYLEELKSEKQERFIDKLLYQTLLGLGFIAAVL